MVIVMLSLSYVNIATALITLVTLYSQVVASAGPAARIRFVRSQTNVIGTVGTEIRLTCRVRHANASSITYWWTRNGIQIKKSKKYRVRFRFLKIRKLEKSDAGKYICWAKNKVGQAQRTINLVVKGPAAPIFAGSQTNFTATVGTNIKLWCRVRHPLYPDASTTHWWTRNGVLINMSKKYRLNQFRFLRLRRVERSDAGEYKCWAKNTGGQVQRTINLVVKVPNIRKSTKDFPPYFTDKLRMSWRSYLSVPVGHDAKIACSADGSPKPTVTWYKNGKKLKYMPDGFTPLTPSSFVITFSVIRPGYSGKYKCVVSNEVGNISFEYTVKVKEIMSAKPIAQSMQNITAYEGDNMTITCKAISDSLPYFQWLTVRSNGSLEVLDPGLSEEDSTWKSDSDRWHGVKLRLVNVTQEDGREYVCMVGNNLGYDFQKFHLKVIPRPTSPQEIEISKPVVLPMQNITAYEGENVTITCKAANNLVPHFQWAVQRPNGSIEMLDSKSRQFAPKSGNDGLYAENLRLINIKREDEKVYYCMVGDDGGYDFQTVHLRVLPRPVTSEGSIQVG